jgi:translation elongation factor EF-4
MLFTVFHVYLIKDSHFYNESFWKNVFAECYLGNTTSEWHVFMRDKYQKARMTRRGADEIQGTSFCSWLAMSVYLNALF